MRKIKLCQIIYEFAPQIGGSITHTIELAKHMAPYCERQFVIVPAVKEDTSDLDRSFPFEVIRVKYHDFKLLQYIKSKWLKWLPVAPLINLSFGWAALKEIWRLNRRLQSRYYSCTWHWGWPVCNISR
jgi:glycosyltransferase involved in cell wall biosynthesis